MVLASRYFLTCICLMAGVPTEMTFNTTSTVIHCQSIIVMTSQRDNTMRRDNALPVTCHSRCASHRTMHMSCRSKTYTWNDVILVKTSMIRVFSVLFFLKTVLLFCNNNIQGDQKVSVHLMITIQSSGAQKLFDHSVYT